MNHYYYEKVDFNDLIKGQKYKIKKRIVKNLGLFGNIKNLSKILMHTFTKDTMN